MIPVSKPFLAPQVEFAKSISKVWETQALSNTDSLVTDLEEKLEKHLAVSNLLFFKNREHAVEVAIKSLSLKGEIITTPFTPFSHVTSDQNLSVDCKFVFVDVDESTFNIDVKKIEASITPKTTAILATHVFGNPCDVLEIDRIAKKHNLKVIYDGTYAFDVQVYGHSIFKYGDISICCTESTKLFHSVNGGFIVANKESIFLRLKNNRNNSIDNGNNITNYKSGFCASLGVLNLKYIDQISAKSKKLTKTYDEYLSKLNIAKPLWHKNSEQNYYCYPLIFESEEMLLRCLKSLEAYQISTSRCFYASPTYIKSKEVQKADSVSKRVLSLPLYYDLKVDQVALICAVIQSEFLESEGQLG